MGARAKIGARAQASRMALKIRCKSFSEYLRILVAAEETSTTGDFIFECLVSCLDNLSPDLGGVEELKGATERATEGATEGRSW